MDERFLAWLERLSWWLERQRRKVVPTMDHYCILHGRVGWRRQKGHICSYCHGDL